MATPVSGHLSSVQRWFLRGVAQPFSRLTHSPPHPKLPPIPSSRKRRERRMHQGGVCGDGMKFKLASAVELIINWSIIMRFYQSSTGGKADQPHVSLPSSLPTTQPSPGLQMAAYSPAFLYYFNTYCTQFLEVSNLLNQELLHNNNLINSRITPPPRPPTYPQQRKKDSQDNSTASRKNASQFYYGEQGTQHQQENLPPPKRRRQPEESSESYHPEEDCSRQANGLRISESKNVPKNYGKAIITFIRKNEEITRRVLGRVGHDYTAFMRNVRSLRPRLNTIHQLRSMWMDEENEFARAYRILSLQYLRKHSLEYIFNSRVENFYKHIKYRYKIIESVSDPTAFTRMKEF